MWVNMVRQSGATSGSTTSWGLVKSELEYPIKKAGRNSVVNDDLLIQEHFLAIVPRSVAVDDQEVGRGV